MPAAPPVVAKAVTLSVSLVSGSVSWPPMLPSITLLANCTPTTTLPLSSLAVGASLTPVIVMVAVFCVVVVPSETS